MVNRTRLAKVSLLGSFLLIAGCAPSLQEIVREPNTKVPEDYVIRKPDGPGQPAAPAKPDEVGKPAAPASPDPKKASPPDSAKIEWKDFFKDEQLVSLIDEALKKNQELAIVQQEVLVSKNEVLARSGEYLPKLGLKAGAGVEKVGKETSQGVSDEANGLPKDLPNLMLGLAATWEIDVWNKLRNATRVALFRYLASVDGRNFMVTHLVAEIADNYYELLALHKKVEILQQNIEIQKQALEIVRLEKQAARVTELAVKRFEAEVLKNQSRMYGLKQQIIEKENRLNFLVGRFPQEIAANASDFIERTPKIVEAGIPSQLLENRPDVKQAELSLKAAKLNVDVARARFYPSFNIEAGAGFQSFNANHLFLTPGSLIYGIAGGLTAPLLNRRGIKADYLSAGSKQMQAVVDFERTILRAFTEVTNQLNKVENLKGTFTLKAQQVEALNTSITISDTLFKAARCDYMEVLLTRRDALEAQMDLVEVKQQQLSAVVDLYQALGGGWKQE